MKPNSLKCVTERQQNWSKENSFIAWRSFDVFGAVEFHQFPSSWAFTQILRPTTDNTWAEIDFFLNISVRHSSRIDSVVRMAENEPSGKHFVGQTMTAGKPHRSIAWIFCLQALKQKEQEKHKRRKIIHMIWSRTCSAKFHKTRFCSFTRSSSYMNYAQLFLSLRLCSF